MSILPLFFDMHLSINLLLSHDQHDEEASLSVRDVEGVTRFRMRRERTQTDQLCRRATEKKT